jgi:hypothetical protein
MPAMYRNKYLFIDDAHLLRGNNLRRKVNQAVKHPEPVVKLDAPWDTEKMEMFNYNNVLYDEEEKLFKMWYVVCGQRPDEYWERGRKTGYATSTDGIHWEKPVMNKVEVRGSTKNNYIFPEMLSLCYTILRDPSDIPARRYKIIFFVDSEEMRWGKFHVPLNLATSADGIHWDRPVHVNPFLRGLSDAGWGFLYDPDRRKYQLYTRRPPNLPRDISLHESFDLVNWEERGRILVPGDEFDPPEMFNFQGMTPFFYEDFCLSLLNTQYSLPESETYEVFHEPPSDWPSDRLGHVDVQLAYSRDGVQWERPDDRSPVVPNGEPGSPDEGVIFVPSANPPVIDGETYIYYTAVRYQHNERTQTAYMEAHDHDMRGAVSCMLAKMPEDHWVSLDSGKDGGWILTRPYGSPSRLLVNADAEGGCIEAEILTPYGDLVDGFTRADCIGVSGSGKDQEIRWKTAVDPRSLNESHRGGLCLKIYVRNAKLYSCSLMEPDPDGEIQGYWANARWNEAILHRSGQWGRRSNDPAGGIPQPPGTQNDSGTRFGPNPRAEAEWT